MGVTHGITRPVLHGVVRTITTGSIPALVAVGAPRASTGAITVPWPSGHAAGDIGLLLLAAPSGTISLATANGFAETDNSPQTCSAAAITTKLSAYWCRATTASQAAPITNANANHLLGVILLFRGCTSTGNPWDVMAGGVTVANSTAISVAGGTTTVSPTCVVAVVSTGVDAGANDASGWANTSLDGFAEVLDISTSIGSGGAIAAAVGTFSGDGLCANSTATLATTSGQAKLFIALK